MGLISVLIFFGNFFSFLGGSITIFHSGLSNFTNEISLNDLVDFLRSNYSIISLLINIIITFFLIWKKFKFNKLFIFCLSILFMPQIISMLINKLFYDFFNIQSFTTITYMLSAAICIINIFTLRNSIYFKYIFIVPFLALFFQLLIFFYHYSFFEIQYGGYNFEIIFGGKVYSLYFNSNGLGRSTTLIYAFSIFHFFNSDTKFKKIFYYIISFFTLFVVFNLSGRFNTLMILLLNFVVFIYYYKTIFKLKNFIFFIFSIFLIVLCVNLYKNNQKEQYKEEIINTKGSAAEKKLENEYQSFKINNTFIRTKPTSVRETDLELLILKSRITIATIIDFRINNSKSVSRTDLELLILKSIIVAIVIEKLKLDRSLTMKLRKNNIKTYNDLKNINEKNISKIQNINTLFFIDESILKILIKEVNRIEENFNLNEVIDKEYIDILMKDGNLELSKTYDFLNNLSTGRISKWNFIYKFHNKKIIGYGPNMDRIFFSENISFNDQKPVTKSIIGANDAASGIVYQYVSSGLIGLIGIIIFYLIIIINFINKKLYLEKSVNERIFISIFILLTLRIIFENSYMIFGIDYLFMIIGLQVLTKKTKISY